MKSAGADLSTSDRIDSTFSMGCVEVVIDPILEGESLALEFYAAPESRECFIVEIWQLTYLGEEERFQRITNQKNLLEVDYGG